MHSRVSVIKYQWVAQNNKNRTIFSINAFLLREFSEKKEYKNSLKFRKSTNQEIKVIFVIDSDN